MEFADVRGVNETRSSNEIRGHKEMARPASRIKNVGDKRRSAHSSVIKRNQEPPRCRGFVGEDDPRRPRSTFAHGRKMPFKSRAIDFVDIRIGTLKSTEIETSGRNDIVK